MDQSALFSSDEIAAATELSAGNNTKEAMPPKHRVDNQEFKGTSFKSTEELFWGFNEIRAITFSYDIKFISKIMKMFDYGEIILGARFMVRRDGDLHNLAAEALLLENMTVSESVADAVRTEKDLVQLMAEKSLLIKSPNRFTDHRKIYLLKSDDGRTRVIKGSANMTRGAWSENQLETFEVDNTYEAYETYLKDFNLVWEECDEIPEDVVIADKTDVPEKDIPVVKKILETQKAILLKEVPNDKEVYEIPKYIINTDKILEKNKELVKDLKLNSKAKNGYIQIIPDVIKKIKTNAKKIRMKMVEVKNEYPQLTFNYNTKEAFINKKPLDLNPSEETVKSDINLLLETFDNYKKDFIGDVNKAIDSHYKLLNILFSSPFHAKLRCVAAFKNISTLSLPLYALIASQGSNSGKTFITELILKLMTNMELKGHTTKKISSSNIDKLLEEYKGLPLFVDEIDGGYFRWLKERIKNSNQCERNLRENQPLFIFASNSISDPEEPERKRMVFLRYNLGLKKDIDLVAYDGISKNIRSKATNALYREYLRRMLEEVSNLIDYMEESENLTDDYYPDIVSVSSKTLINILKDYGYELPDYIRELNWHNDFSYHAKYISQDAMEEIRTLWKNDPDCFTIKPRVIIITSGSDRGSKKMLESWANSLPIEFKAKYSDNREMSKIMINRQELEKALGFSFNKNKLLRFFRRD
ncbi:MAG: phospholipase D family protein [Negativicoccus succinicivorans]|nr:phospholipase D family protein [Negativicoccus succinicivorans]